MTITVSGKHMDIGDSLRAHVVEHLSGIIERYMHEKPDANCTFSKSHHLFSVDLSVHLNHHFVVHCKAQGGDAYLSFNTALQKLENRIKRYKARLRDKHRHDNYAPQSHCVAKHYIVEHCEDDTGSDTPLVIADMLTEIQPLSVGEAVMRLDLMAIPVLLFKNAGSNHLNVVYRRHDGHIGWIDPDALNEK